MLLSNTLKNRAGVLVILTDRPHPQNGSINHSEIPVRPSDVAQWIRQAVQLGWQPQLPEITFKVPIAGLFIEKI
ncbi:hypothetical protein QUA41_07845 [Microcoleus sp. Pol11C1]|uniref:hypothetical protein n=1 Tax=unclassified Microcoleus TaxID=2642155 RepID=UPI002FD09B20